MELIELEANQKVESERNCKYREGVCATRA
eukprot:COSAG06_NODE_151_length_21964_cov_95.963961_2_plen_30_part_00